MRKLSKNTDRGRRGRRYATRNYRRRFLIVCEGEKTEPHYFRAFPVSSDVYLRVKGEGRNTTSLVRVARKYADDAASANEPYDEVWVVYDHDDFPDEKFNQAECDINTEDRKREEHWGAAWSNQSFELWYFLHFEYCESALHRDNVLQKLSKHLRSNSVIKNYKKNDSRMYEVLSDRQSQAIIYAKKLEQMHKIAPHGTLVPSKAHPCTTVHRLVEALNREIF